MRLLAADPLRNAGVLFVRAALAVPRRQFDLPRWTRRREFRELHQVSVAWLGSHFGLIEQGAPWLHQVGSDVWDFCKGGVSNRFLQFTGGSGAGVSCRREVTAVYGFDGQSTSRLRSLDQAMPTAGWEMAELAARQRWQDLDGAATAGAATAEGLARHRTRWMTDRQVTMSWHPTAALSYPSGGEGTPPWGRPPLTPRMRVTWSSRGQATGWLADPNKTRGAMRGYLPLEVTEASVPELLEQALTRYEHGLTVTIQLNYYSNPNARARPHRVPRYLFPTRPGR